MPRVRMIEEREDTSPSQVEAFDHIAASRGGQMIRPFAAMIHRPEIARAAADLGAVIRFESTLSDHDREVVICTTAIERDCPFVWESHTPIARRAGVATRSALWRSRLRRIFGIQPLEQVPPADDVAVWCHETKDVSKRITLHVLLPAHEHKLVLARRREVVNHDFNERLPGHFDERFGKRVAALGKLTALAAHRHDDLNHAATAVPAAPPSVRPRRSTRSIAARTLK